MRAVNDHDLARLRSGPTGQVQLVFGIGNLTRLRAVRRLKQASEAPPQTNKTCRMSPILILHILIAAKDLTDRSDTGGVAGMKSSLKRGGYSARPRTTGRRGCSWPGRHKEIERCPGAGSICAWAPVAP